MSKNAKANLPVETDNSRSVLEARRNFLKLGGLGIAALAIGGVAKTDVFANPASKQTTQTVNLGTGDVAVLNFAYLLEQLEAQFYAQVVTNSYYAGATAEERQILGDLRDHESIHRQFFKAAITAAAPTQVIPDLTLNFSLVDFNSRDSVLTISQILEDTGVSAYNGAGQIIASPDYLTLAGKIVSVEARHASAIRDLRIPRNGFFADSGTDFAQDPRTVLNLAAPFFPMGLRVVADGIPRTIVV